MSHNRIVPALLAMSILGGMMFASGGCSNAAAKKSGEITPASFKADPSRMTESEKKSYERLTGSKPPAAPASQ